MKAMSNANEYGFLPENAPSKNSEAFQKAVDNGGCIQVTVPGIYKISEQIEIASSACRPCGLPHGCRCFSVCCNLFPCAFFYF